MNNYSGILTVPMNDGELADFYEHYKSGEDFCFMKQMVNNQYLVIESSTGELIGPYFWCAETKVFEDVPFRTFSSNRFGDIRPKDKDPYQMAYMDSLVRNQLTFCTGPAGSGKTLIALAYAFQEYEKGHISKIVVFTNPLIATGAVKLGFLPGTKTDKLLETSIGRILISKIGSRIDVEEMMEHEDLILLPMGDARGYEVPEDSFVYFSEAQNTSKYLMKLFLQRTNDNCKICVEGDERQVDSDFFEAENNGMRRAIEVFRGESYAGHVQLKTIYRGRIARKAEEICD